MNNIFCRLFIPNTRGELVRPFSALFLSLLASAYSGAADAQISDNVVRIGVLGDLSGVYADFGGPGNVVAARMAVEDFGGKVLGKPIEVIAADHQSKADIGAAIARQWFDADKIDMAIGFDNSSIALAVEQVAFQKNRIAIAGAVSTTAFTGKDCTPNEAAWLHDNYALANTLVRSEKGGDTWFFITADYTAGHSLEVEAKNAVLASGGKVLGAVRHPLNNPDFSSYLLQAQASGAKVIALANFGGDMTNATKQANDFGLSRAGNQSLVSLLVFITDIHGLGLAVTQGLQFATAFYWDRDDESRAWSKRFFAIHQRMPTSAHAAVYSATRHYLRAIEAAGTDDAKAVMAKMREMPINDFFAKNGKLREDGRMVHDMYLVEVKTPAESRGPWDYNKIIATIPGDQAFRRAGEDGCPLIKR
jgi:branched-chain amino acid transport system substrate-binding protein